MMIKKAYVDTPNGQIHYHFTTGGEGPPLVLFHMTAASSDSYAGLMAQLDGNIPCIAPDTVNYGQSYRTQQAPSMGLIADVMLDAIDALGIDAFHTFGHHTGASIQSAIAVKAPERVLSMIVNGPNYASMAQNEHLMQTLVVDNPVKTTGTQFIAAWSRIKDNYPIPLWGDTAGQAAIMNRDAIDMLRAGPAWHWAYRAVFADDLPAAMKATRCPKLFVCGGQDPAIEFHHQACRDFPDAPSHVFDAGGIYYMESHPEDLAPVMIDFLKGLDGAG